MPTPALRNSLYLAKTEFQMNEDHFGKKSLVTNAQYAGSYQGKLERPP